MNTSSNAITELADIARSTESIHLRVISVEVWCETVPFNNRLQTSNVKYEQNGPQDGTLNNTT